MAAKSKLGASLKMVLVVVVSVALTLIGTQYLGNPLGRFDTRHKSAVLNSMERVEEVALLSLGIQEIRDGSEDRELLNMTIPGTTKSSKVQFSFQAKIGINGKDVQVEEVSGNNFEVQIPKFEFIGMENLDVQVINEKNGLLSWVTPEVDKNELLDQVINSDVKHSYVRTYDEELRHQAEQFYRGLITGVSPEATVEFSFAD